MLNFEEGTMVRGQPIVLNNGEYLLPLYYETGADREKTAGDTVSYFMRYDPKTKTWSESRRIRSSMGNLQAQVVQMTDEYLIAYIRRGGDFEPTDHSYVLRSESRDGHRAGPVALVASGVRLGPSVSRTDHRTRMVPGSPPLRVPSAD